MQNGRQDNSAAFQPSGSFSEGVRNEVELSRKSFFGQILEISLPKSSKSGVFTPFSAFSGHSR
jgi:hypothetical protein